MKFAACCAGCQECVDYYKNIGVVGVEGKNNIAVVYSQQAQIYQQRGEYEQALDLVRKAMKIDEELENEEGLVVDHFRIAQLLCFIKRYDEALTASETVLAKAKAINNHLRIAQGLHQRGLTLNMLNRPQEAFKCFQESLQISERIDDREGQANSLGEIGKILLNTGQFNAAIDLFQKAIEIYFEQNNPVKAAIVLEAIGVTLEQQGHFREALEKYQEALRLMKEHGGPQYVAHIEGDIARVKAKLGR